MTPLLQRRQGYGPSHPFRDVSPRPSISVVIDPHYSDRDRLYSEFAPLVNRLIHRYGTDAETRKDLSGEIFTIFNDLLDAYDPERGVPLRPYLVRQLTASVYTHVRARWNRRVREFAIQLDSPVVEQSLMEDPTEQWNHLLAQEPVMRAIASALQHLTKRQRQVVILRYYEDRSFEEIGSQLEICPATARSLLRKALQRLRTILQPSSILID